MIAETAQILGDWSKIVFLDDALDAEKNNAHHVIGRFDEVANFVGAFTDALPVVGNNQLRMDMLRRLKVLGFTIPKVIHPRAYVSPSAMLGIGCIVLPGAMVSTNARLGDGCLVNMGALVDHDCVLEEGVHLGMGSIVRNGYRVKALASVQPNILLE